MNCDFDLKEYVLGEAARDVSRAIEAHAAECGACKDEIARLRLTHTALRSLREEEPPRRIAFVSDKVFEPRWYERLWNSAPRLGFASAAMLAGAIVLHGVVQPRPGVTAPAPVVDAQAIEQRIEAQVAARLEGRVQQAVAKAVADSEQRQKQNTTQMLLAAERRYDLDRRATLAALGEQQRIVQQQVSNLYIASNQMRAGE